MATISSTIGTGGSYDYTSPPSWHASIPSNTSDRYVGTCMVDEQYTSTFYFSVSNSNLINHTLTVHPDVRHNGSWSSGGARIQTGGTSPAIINACGGTTIEFIMTRQTGSREAFRWTLDSHASYTSNTIGVHMVGAQTGASAGRNNTARHDGINSGDSVFNYVGCTFETESGATTADATIHIVDVADGVASVNFINCTAVRNLASGTVFNNANNASDTVKVNNFKAFGGATCFATAGAMETGDNNVSSDATAFGTTNYRNESRSDHTVSATDLRRNESLDRASYIGGDEAAGYETPGGQEALTGNIDIGAWWGGLLPSGNDYHGGGRHHSGPNVGLRCGTSRAA